MRIFVSLLFVSTLASTVHSRQANTQQEPPAFDAWLEELIDEAKERGYEDALIDQTLRDLTPRPIVVERDRGQAELTLTFERYFTTRVNMAVVRRGRELARQQGALLARIELAYGVPRQIILSIWGLESRYGRNTGVTPVFQALATLAWEPRRATFFRGQLFDALSMVSRGNIDAATMKGSWAGAMGQPQFMPSSYLEYAVDFDKDGRADIWRSTPDALASIAHYLQGYGWMRGEVWGREVRIPAAARERMAAIPRRTDGCSAMRDMTERRPLDEWGQLGVRRANGAALPRATIGASVVQADDRSFLVYPNYDALLGYNCAKHYALSVAMLADRLR